MSMLAERKRKQKWSLNPRGKAWAEDSSKFGQKLLEKMGWSHGKGLGANEDGRIEHIKVSYKNDSQGMGYKESDNQWTEHESNFTALLATLGGGEHKEAEIKLSSLEKKSENSKVRLHYRKFTRGKDLSRYSEKDLANIFGKKSLKEIKKANKELEVIEQEVTEEIERDKNFSNAGLMSDYFKKKLPSIGRASDYVIGNNGVLRKGDDSESETDHRPSFGLGFSQTGPSESSKTKSTFVSFINDCNVDQIAPKKKKDKKKRAPEDDAVNVHDTPTKKKKLEAQEALEAGSIKKKKDKIKKKIKQNCGLANAAFDPLYSPVKIEKHILDPIEESTNESVNSSLNDTVGQVAESFEVQVQIVNETTPVKRREEICKNNGSQKKNKKKDKTNGIDNSYENVDIEDRQLEEIKITAREKRKLKTSSETEVSCIGEVPLSAFKKKKSKSKAPQEGSDNPLFNMSLESNGFIEEIPVNPYEVKIKKKKKSKNNENLGIENPLFHGKDQVDAQDLRNEEFELKRKDKKKKKRDENKGLDNLALSLNDTLEEEGCDLMLNVVATPIIVEAVQPNQNGSVKIDKVKGVIRRKSVRFSDVTRERIIPSKEEIGNETLDDSRDIVEVQGKLNDSSDLSLIDKFMQKKKAKKRNKGLDNGAFDQQANSIEESISAMSNSLDTFQAEIENDINEAKIKSVEIDDIMVGEVGTPEGPNERLPDGTVKLKFKYANFRKTARYLETLTGAKKSYKHLIKGDVVMAFNETNLHEIDGYAAAIAHS